MTSSNGSERSLAVVGCGAVVEEFYAPALAGLEKQGWVLSFVDASLDRARAVAGRFRAGEAHDSLEAVVARATHAIVATPPGSHFVLCRQLLAAGVDVLCEKPLTLELGEGRDLVERAARAGRTFHVNQTRRWFPASLEARRLLSEGAIGEPATVSFRFGTRFNWPAKTGFHSDPALARNGILSDQGSHVFDLIGWILGRDLEPVSVQHDGYAGPESTVRVEFTSGRVSGSAVMTWLLTIPSTLEFVGTKGRLILDDDCNRVLLQRGGATENVVGNRRYTSYSAIAVDLLSAFVERREAPGVAPASSVLPSIAFLDRAYTMATPTLPLVTDIGRRS